MANADTERSEASPSTTGAERVDEGDQNARAACAQRVSERDRATVDVHPRGRVLFCKAEALKDRERLSCEGFIELD